MKNFRAATVSLTLAVGMSFASACATVVSNVPLRGDPNTIKQLVGSWEGVYNSAGTGRSGIITFQLRAGTDTAQGDVIMIPRGDRAQLLLSPDELARQRNAPAQLLTIRFVAVENNQVMGVLDPYADPECGCLLTTRFIGKLNGDDIKGTFVSTGSGMSHETARGTWSVRRNTTVRATVSTDRHE